MNNQTISYTDKKYCRLCLEPSNKLNSVFTNNGSISKYIQIFFAVEIEKNDPYSNKICQNCLDSIIAIIKQRIKFRENDKFIKGIVRNNSDNTPPQNEDIDIKNKVNKKPEDAIHPSVKKIFDAYTNILIPEYFWSYNFAASVDIKMSPSPWPRYETDRPKPKPKRRKKIGSSSVRKHKRYMDDPSISYSLSHGPSTDNESETESVHSFVSSSGNKRLRRNVKSPATFGDTIFYEQSGVDALDDMLPEDSQCESYYIYNKHHTRPSLIETKEKRNNTSVNDTTSPLNSQLNFINDPKNSSELIIIENDSVNDKLALNSLEKSSVNEFLTKIQSNSLPWQPTKHKNIKKRETNLLTNIKKNRQCTSRKYNKTFQDNTLASDDSSCQPVRCTEEKWNRFFNSYYEQPVSAYESVDDENNSSSFLLMSGPERMVYLCHFCSEILDSEKSLKRHISSHENNPVLNLQKRYYQNYVNKNCDVISETTSIVY